MSGTVRFISSYKSDLGNALFKGDDFHSLQLRSIVGELQLIALSNKLQPDLNGIAQVLGGFLPAHIRENPVKDYWYQRDLENWSSVQRPTIVAALEAYFIDGGKENDAESISSTLELLEKYGITIECKDKLISELSAGEWRSKLAMIALQGRQIGIRFIAGCPNLEALSDALKKLHGFSDDQVKLICGNIVITK